ncbi:uncharacterized protein LOC125551609 [Triticum urartu]|uniref:uncharacterized protein LOC125551609 n=1 Tax=Triticum urartu TaxID=4572 RepID=UPI0020430EC0|nr:uncharacterized protein LOC125551609 [Triticum urartu]
MGTALLPQMPHPLLPSVPHHNLLLQPFYYLAPHPNPSPTSSALPSASSTSIQADYGTSISAEVILMRFMSTKCKYLKHSVPPAALLIQLHREGQQGKRKAIIVYVASGSEDDQFEVDI